VTDTAARQRRARPRFLYGLIILVALVVPLTMTVPAQAATYRPGCDSQNWRWGLHATLGGHIADLHETATRCWNSRGNLTSRNVTMWVDNRFWGNFFGFQYPHSVIYVASSTSSQVVFARNYSVKDCVGFSFFKAGFTWCGHAAGFHVTATISPRWAENQFNNGYLWGVPYCTNSWCRAHLQFGFK
jgi:hypothetical protein